MVTSDFSTQLSAFLSDYLPKQRNVSGNTIASYCDTFRLFLRFCSQYHDIRPEKMKLKDMTASLVREYLRWIQDERGCGINTRNQRLAAINSFVKYVNTEVPENLAEFMKILKIPQKKSTEQVVDYLNVEDMTLVLRQPNANTQSGRQHLVMLSLLYDSACRVQELVDLKVRDVRCVQKKITVHGKGRKVRELPLTTNTLELLKLHLEEYRLNTPERQDFPLFRNHQRVKMTRAGVTYILKKYIDKARVFSNTIPIRVTPHIIRHTKAMHLLQADIPLHVIQDILGHSDITTTERYARANLVMKEHALESTHIKIDITEPNYLDSRDTIEWLSQYAKECRE